MNIPSALSAHGTASPRDPRQRQGLSTLACQGSETRPSPNTGSVWLSSVFPATSRLSAHGKLLLPLFGKVPAHIITTLVKTRGVLRGGHSTLGSVTALHSRGLSGVMWPPFLLGLQRRPRAPWDTASVLVLFVHAEGPCSSNWLPGDLLLGSSQC